MDPSEEGRLYRERNRTFWAEHDPYASSAPKRCSTCKLERPRRDFTTNGSNPDGLHRECRACNANRTAVRRAQIRGAWVEDVDRTVVWKRDQGVCYLCGRAADPQQWDLDHVHPLSKGGEHSYANVAVTHPSCNRSKNGTPWPEVESFYP